jgi:hypothetical protein
MAFSKGKHVLIPLFFGQLLLTAEQILTAGKGKVREIEDETAHRAELFSFLVLGQSFQFLSQALRGSRDQLLATEGGNPPFFKTQKFFCFATGLLHLGKTESDRKSHRTPTSGLCGRSQIRFT